MDAGLAFFDVIDMRGPFLPCLFCLLALLYGCGPAPVPTPPKSWAARNLGAAEPVPGGRARLQIIITYDAEFSTHAALRLDQNGRGPIFWDPAGRYGELDDARPGAEIIRINDLILKNPPTLGGYWQSSVNASDVAMEVFEWSLSARQAAEATHLLLVGAGIIDGKARFETKTSKPFCSVAISDFFQKLEESPVQLSDSYLMPHRLARALYAQRPDRVVIFRRGQEPRAYHAGMRTGED